MHLTIKKATLKKALTWPSIYNFTLYIITENSFIMQHLQRYIQTRSATPVFS